MNNSSVDNISKLVTESYHSRSFEPENGERNRLRSSSHQDLSIHSDSDLNGLDSIDCWKHGLSKCCQQSRSKAKKTGLSRIVQRVSKKFPKFSSRASYDLLLKNRSLSRENVNSMEQTDDVDCKPLDLPVLWRSRSLAMSNSCHEVLEERSESEEDLENMRKHCERLFRSKSMDPRQAKVGDSSSSLTLEQPKRRKPRISHTTRKFTFNPCFSPTVSDDELSVHEDEAQPTSSQCHAGFVNPFRRNATPTRDETSKNVDNSHSSVIPRPLANAAGSALKAAKDLRARLALVASAENQLQGPANLRRLSTTIPAGVSIPGFPERKTVHTVVEYTNVLMPDLISILNSPYYWGTMDRYEAEKLLESKPEGTFLLRDSAQINYVFSVSFRRYQRTLHARIEQSDGKFSFDIHDSTVFSAPKITELIENYKDPSRCLFFEPQLSVPLCRNFVFSLKEISRAVVAGCCTSYDSAMNLPVPSFLKRQVREYHYKQPIRVTDKD